MAQASEIRYLTPPTVDVKKKKYCRFKKSGIKYIDYKIPNSSRVPQRTGKDPAASHYRHFFEVPAPRGTGRKACTSPFAPALRN